MAGIAYPPNYSNSPGMLPPQSNVGMSGYQNYSPTPGMSYPTTAPNNPSVPTPNFGTSSNYTTTSTYPNFSGGSPYSQNISVVPPTGGNYPTPSSYPPNSTTPGYPSGYPPSGYPPSGYTPSGYPPGYGMPSSGMSTGIPGSGMNTTGMGSGMNTTGMGTGMPGSGMNTGMGMPGSGMNTTGMSPVMSPGMPSSGMNTTGMGPSYTATGNFSMPPPMSSMNYNVTNPPTSMNPNRGSLGSSHSLGADMGYKSNNLIAYTASVPPMGMSSPMARPSLPTSVSSPNMLQRATYGNPPTGMMAPPMNPYASTPPSLTVPVDSGPKMSMVQRAIIEAMHVNQQLQQQTQELQQAALQQQAQRQAILPKAMSHDAPPPVIVLETPSPSPSSQVAYPHAPTSQEATQEAPAAVAATALPVALTRAEILAQRRQSERILQTTIQNANEELNRKMEALERQKELKEQANKAEQEEREKKAQEREAQRIREEEHKKLTQSFYSAIVETVNNMASSVNRLSFLFSETFNELFDQDSPESELMNDTVTLLDSLSTRMDAMLRSNVLAVDPLVHEAVVSATNEVTTSLQGLLSFTKKFSSPEGADLKASSSEKQEEESRSNILKVSLSLKSLVEVLEKQKLVSESGKEALSMSCDHKKVLGAEVRIIEPRPHIQRPNYTPTKMLKNYNPTNVATLQTYFKAVAAKSKWQNMVSDFKQSKASRGRRDRFNILSEILSTEESYVNFLEKMLVHWKTPMINALKNPECTWSSVHVANLFLCLDTIYELNKEILCQLQSRTSKFPIVTTLADIFVKMGPMLKMYTDYVTKHEIALDTYAELMKDPKFVEFDSVCQMNAKTKLALPAILIMPAQRVPRYEMLIKGLLKHTPPTHPDFENLTVASDLLQKLNVHINAQKQKAEIRQKVTEVEARIVSDVPLMLVAPHRLYIKDGPVIMMDHRKKREAHLYLLNDLAILCKVRKKQVTNNIFGFGESKTISVHNFYKRINLARAIVKADEKEQSFSLIIGGDTIKLTVSDAEEKTAWVKEIHEAIQTRALKDMLDTNIKQNTLKKAFAILSASYGALEKEKTTLDVTEKLKEIVQEQGGSLTLAKGSKGKLFGNPNILSKKQLLIVYSVNGNVKRKIFSDTEAIHLDSSS
eukprot:TRINITY_DN5860_c0_g1_i2.p1 TRINITY_DN5860_c0_g1~~TRINITY_DN5860_c0_g1_i2.p1  ORF type:complete len:1195 (-),score=248.51 TRINITY_DN5860_c0_g1_i2:56-3478(-)